MSISKAQAGVLTSMYAGLRRTGFLHSALGRKLFTNAYFFYKRALEDPFAALSSKHPELFQKGDILDIGANIGYTACVFASAIDDGRCVYAFEPESMNFEMLRSVAAQSGSSIVPVKAAIGAHDGEVQIFKNEAHHADHRVMTEMFRATHAEADLETVQLLSVDSFMKDREGPICFIKVDVQGYEPAVCEGMWKTIERSPNTAVALEYTPAAMRELGLDLGPTLRTFYDRGYAPFRIGKRGELTSGLPDLKDDEYADILFVQASARPNMT